MRQTLQDAVDVSRQDNGVTARELIGGSDGSITRDPDFDGGFGGFGGFDAEDFAGTQ